jgi:hypothetical protein
MKWVSRLGYATHIPVMIEIAKRFKIENIVEIGSGPVSTRLFLDKNIFKDVKSLLSFEHNEGWFNKMNKIIKDDRLEYVLTDKTLDFFNIINGGDLLFLDGLKGHRIHGLEVIGKKFKLVVLHDSTMGKVMRGVKYSAHYKYVKDYVPPKLPAGQGRSNPTAMMSNHINLDEIKWNFKWKENLELMKRLMSPK